MLQQVRRPLLPLCGTCLQPAEKERIFLVHHAEQVDARGLRQGAAAIHEPDLAQENSQLWRCPVLCRCDHLRVHIRIAKVRRQDACFGVLAEQQELSRRIRKRSQGRDIRVPGRKFRSKRMEYPQQTPRFRIAENERRHGSERYADFDLSRHFDRLQRRILY